jgi:hypothetical protein
VVIILIIAIVVVVYVMTNKPAAAPAPAKRDLLSYDGPAVEKRSIGGDDWSEEKKVAKYWVDTIKNLVPSDSVPKIEYSHPGEAEI